MWCAHQTIFSSRFLAKFGALSLGSKDRVDREKLKILLKTSLGLKGPLCYIYVTTYHDILCKIMISNMFYDLNFQSSAKSRRTIDMLSQLFPIKNVLPLNTFFCLFPSHAF